MIADVLFAGFLEFGTATPSPVRRERWIVHSGHLASETPLPEDFATYSDQTATSSVSAGALLPAEVTESSAAVRPEQTAADDPGGNAYHPQRGQQAPAPSAEQPASIEDLFGALSFTQIVAQVMPVHEDLDRRAARALRKRAADKQPRKLSKK